MNTISFSTLSFLALIFAISLSGITNAQEKGLMLSKYYSTKDYRAGTQNWAIAEDSRGVMYFGNVSGVLKYNGETWKLIPNSNYSAVRSLGVDSNGIVYVGGFNEMGFLLPDNTGDLKYNSLLGYIDDNYRNFGEIWSIQCFTDTVYLLSAKYMFRLANGKIEVWESHEGNFYLSHNANNEQLVQELGRGMLRMVDDNLRLIERGDFFSEIRVHKIFPYDDGMLICSRNNGLFLYENQGGRVTIKSLDEISPKAKRLNKHFIDHSFYQGVELTSSLLALSTITGSILVVDKYSWDVIDVIGNETIKIKSPTFYLHFKKNQGLWLALDNGICLVEVLSPFRYWDEAMGISGVITDVAQLRDTMYVSAGSGVFYSSASSGEPFSYNYFTPVKGRFEQAWEYLYFIPKLAEGRTGKTFADKSLKTKLMVSSRMGLFEISGGKAKRISDYEALFKLYQSKSDSSRLYMGTSKGLASLYYANGVWNDEGVIYEIDSRIDGIGEDDHGNLWFSAGYRGVFRISKPFSKKEERSVDKFDTQHGLPSLKTINIFDDEGAPLTFYVEREYYKFNDSTEVFQIFDPWANNGVDSTYHPQIDTLSWYRVWDDIISNFYVTHLDDTIVWFSTNAGTFRYSFLGTKSYADIPSALITQVTAGDSVLFNGTNFRSSFNSTFNEETKIIDSNPIVDIGTILKFSSNSVTFHFALPYYESDIDNKYSFILEGYDKSWSDWSEETKKEYTNLPFGKYSFKVKAKNLYNVESEVAEFRFTIQPPWYLTYYAFAGYILLLVLLIYFIVRLYTYRLIKEKDKLEALVKMRTQEILIQKEEILVQAEHLKEANDWITAKNVELETQKNEIEKKKNQLEISDATKNKFFRIIAHDLRSPISTIVSTTNFIIGNIDNYDKDSTKLFIENLNRLSLTTYNLLENLLDWSSNQMGEIRFKPQAVNLNSLLAENLELVKTKTDSKGIKLKVSIEKPIEVYADENMLSTIIRNLISNATKFTHDHGNIEISAKIKQGFCHLSVQDNGVGISPENLKNLFRIDKDVRTDGTHKEKGSGLGLILCKEFVELNGGKISVKSEVDKGSTFTVSIKLAN